MWTVQTWSCDIFRSNGPIRKLETPLRLSESQDHLYDMQWMNLSIQCRKKLMHLMREQNNACDARMIFFFFFVHGWSLQSSSLIKSWVQNQVSIGMFDNCFFLLFSVSKNNFLFFRLKNLFGNPKWTENKNYFQNSICEGNWKHAKGYFQFLIFKSQWKHAFNLMNLSHLMS